uniref:Uncharacterized protein n=1 Tax=Rhizophora mucronata TaxID=61149 RepID=A0A2P2NAG4_RHIMU
MAPIHSAPSSLLPRYGFLFAFSFHFFIFSICFLVFVLNSNFNYGPVELD